MANICKSSSKDKNRLLPFIIKIPVDRTHRVYASSNPYYSGRLLFRFLILLSQNQTPLDGFSITGEY